METCSGACSPLRISSFLLTVPSSWGRGQTQMGFRELGSQARPASLVFLGAALNLCWFGMEVELPVQCLSVCVLMHLHMTMAQSSYFPE